MDAASLLAAYARLHDEGVRTGDFAPLAALFADDGEILFHGPAVPPLRGPAAIERGFRERGPADVLAVGAIVDDAPTRAHTIYGWGRAPGLIDGGLRLASRDGRIARLDVFVRRGGPAAPTDRDAARVIVVAGRAVPGAARDAEPRVLLLRCCEPTTRTTVWITPGGGVDPGEDHVRAARRELTEELGPVEGALGPCVWTREHTFLWNHNVVRQRERYFLMDVAAPFVPAPALGPEAIASEGLLGHRWWTVAELAAGDPDVFSPRRFASLVAALLRDGPPDAPLDTGI